MQIEENKAKSQKGREGASSLCFGGAHPTSAQALEQRRI